MRAIDLYAGIGGWGLGLRLAGADLIASYERWQPAIDTHNGNLGGDVEPVDIRMLNVDSLPNDIDLVVGSPPCTEFSYANRGGSGNITEGLKDLVKFFEVVDHLKPKFWAMENVPRVAEVLRHGFKDPNHALHRFRHLDPQITVIDFSEFGTPQARKRCIATNIPLERLLAYRERMKARTLGDIVKTTSSNGEVVDPVWGVSIPEGKLTETETEAPLNMEELRMNREAKEFHPVYNNMAFPDPLGVAARTVTATCTRVSRESIVISDPKEKGTFRRLTIRERASLQGFPITYQFYARSFAEKAKMIGNAIPPTFTYILARVAQGHDAETFLGFEEASGHLALPARAAPRTLPDGEGKTYPLSRSFRAAIPGLRFKSGMRFELANIAPGTAVEWRMRFFFGPSKDIREIELLGEVTKEIQRNPLFNSLLNEIKNDFSKTAQFLEGTTPSKLQLVWAHKATGIKPYEVVDRLGALASELHNRLAEHIGADDLPAVGAYILSVAASSNSSARAVGQNKLEKYALPILAGLIVGEWFNSLIWHCEQRVAA